MDDFSNRPMRSRYARSPYYLRIWPAYSLRWI